MSIDYAREVERLVRELFNRDADPSYGDAPVLDVYARISRRKSGNPEDKTIVQTWRCLTQLVGMHARLGELLVDEARSAWKQDGARPAFEALLGRCKARASHGVIVRFTDRLARQPWDLEQLIHVGDKTRYRVVTADATYHFNKWREVDDLRAEIRAGQRESAQKSDRIRDKVAVRRAAGDGRNGRAPFGHRWRLADVTDEQLAAERAGIRWGIQHVTDGGSWGEVAVRWTADGLRPRWTKCNACDKAVASSAERCPCGGELETPHWHNGNVRSALYGPGSTPTVGLRHAGILHTGGEVVGSIVDADGPIVTLAEWRAFEAVVSSRGRGRQRGDVESRYYASGTLICGGTHKDGRPCRTPLVGTAQPGRYADSGEQRYGYKCPPRGCKGVTVDGRAAEEWCSTEAAKVIVDGGNTALLAHIGHDDRLAELDRLIADTEAAVAVEQRRYDACTNVERRAAIADRLVEREHRLTGLERERDALHELERVERMKPSDVAELCALWNNDDTPVAQRRDIMRQCLPDGVFVRPVGKGARLRGEQIFTRFYVKGGDA